MTRDRLNEMDQIEALRVLLESHGADRTRWPAPERLRFAGLISENAEARRLIAEATAFDRLLDLAPEPSSADVERLASRIVAAADAKMPGGVKLAGSAGCEADPHASTPPLSRGSPLRLPSGGGRPRRSRPDNLAWPAAALLAASLVMGVFAGAAGLIDTVVAPMAGSGNANNDDDADADQLALDADASPLLEEDLL